MRCCQRRLNSPADALDFPSLQAKPDFVYAFIATNNFELCAGYLIKGVWGDQVARSSRPDDDFLVEQVLAGFNLAGVPNETRWWKLGAAAPEPGEFLRFK